MRQGAKQNHTEGSVTVEASILMITVISVILICIYYVLCLHDKTVLEETVQRIALESSTASFENTCIGSGEFDWLLYNSKGILWRLNGSFQDNDVIKAYAVRQAEGKLIVCSKPQFDVIRNRQSVQIRYRAEVSLPLMLDLKNWNTISVISGSAGASGVEQEEIIRLIRGIIGDKRLQDLVQEGDGEK